MIRLILNLVQYNNYSTFHPTILVNDDILYIRAINDQNNFEEIVCRFDLVDLAIQWRKNSFTEFTKGFRIFRQQSRYKVRGESYDELMWFQDFIEGKIPISIKWQEQYEKVKEEPTFFQENSIIVKDKSTKKKQIMKRIYQNVQVPVDEFKIEVYLQRNPHPNILRWNSHCIDKKKQFITLDYQQYVTLDQIFSRYKKVPLKIVKEIMIQLLNGIRHLHSNYIMHKDIKPENIIITNFEKPKVKIGGFSQAVFGQEFCRFGGSPFYRPPEVIEGFIHTNKFDIYSAGVVLYELLKNKRIQRRIYFQKDSSKLQQLEIDPAAVDLVTQMLHPDPYQRLDVIECLDHYFFIDEQPYVGKEKERLFSQSIKPRFIHN
ncbi:unnamed protein product (macronuclear) [Paramecium tetraurelia]|uniref:Protein kinase domain-containing protein n=1 Tax=Paramecium tetraurelia TaxID=5888 RepID=A0C1T9_PARTE|nr:uncharacterized protein GSPATT00034233001 [Paramecium tetraurelia]CAK64756.1 unnamed protein product [Paramecium tetraurelia]|eukprot:XP_001432153.1 hypothetical protein (macronuclear) [Paramecium tetraurelia strain d4-2]